MILFSSTFVPLKTLLTAIFQVLYFAYLKYLCFQFRKREYEEILRSHFVTSNLLSSLRRFFPTFIQNKVFAKQYGEITVREYNNSHNRYLIIDSNEVYDLGTSLNKIGRKIFTINRLEIKEVKDVLIKLFCQSR